MPILLYLLLFLVTPVHTLASNVAENVTGTVVSNDAFVYYDPELRNIMGKSRKGRRLEIIAQTLDVYQVVFAHKIGFIHRSLVDTTPLKTRADLDVSLSYISFLTYQDITWKGFSIGLRAAREDSFLYHFTGSLLKAYDANVTYTAYEIGAGIGYKFSTTRKYQTELVLKGLFIPYLEYVKDNTFNESTYAYGAEVSLDNYLRATENLSFFLGLLLRQIQSGTMNFPDPYKSEKLSFVGYGINLGLFYAF